jgi:acetolactate synthase-1/2/3 large subunit
MPEQTKALPATSRPAGATPMKGAEILVRALEREGVEVVFAYPGGASMEIHQYLTASTIHTVLPRHEQGGAFAAAGYARRCGKTGVCMATSGPGATNLVTGIADAYMDSVPMVAITGQVPQSLIGKNAFQEIDIIGMTRPVVKHSFLVLDVAEIPRVIAEAFYIAGTGRPGPVVIDLPKDVQQASCVPEFPENPRPRAYTIPSDVPPEAVAQLRQAITDCERPCLYVGGGIIISDAQAELLQFAESYNIPVATSLMGVGAFPERHPLSLKWPGMHGTYYATYAVNEADLLIGIGMRYDDRVTGPVKTFAPGAKIVHVDIDPSEINKNKHADIAAVCDAKAFLQAMLPNPIRKDYADWHEQIRTWKAEHPLYIPQGDELQPQYVISELDRLTDGQATIVTGVGQHQMWSAQFYRFRHSRQLLTSGGLGTMGFGLPSAIGAKIACPDEDVILIDGDGSFQMNIQELGMVHCENVPVKMIILNNQHLGMVAQWEDRFYNGVRGNTVLSSGDGKAPYPDFIKIAEGYGVKGRHVWTKDELEDAMKEMLASDEPYLLDIHVAYQEHVLPMIPSGGSYKDIMTE